jgi:AraC-like DNA-binding protein
MAANIPVAPFPRSSNLAPAGALVAVYEWRCEGHLPACPEECSEADEVVVPRWGAFLREVEGRRVLADPGSALFFHRAESYRVRHPVRGGDGGTVFRLAAGAVAELLVPHAPSAADRPNPRLPVPRIPLEGRAWVLHRLARRAALDPAVPPLEVEERAVAFLRAVVAEAARRSGRQRPAVPADRNPLAAEYAARVAEVVAARYRERLMLGEVARAVGCSPFHLSRLVTAAAGVPIHRMIVRRRPGRGRAATGDPSEHRRDRAGGRLRHPRPSHRRIPAGIRPPAERGAPLQGMATTNGFPPSFALTRVAASCAASRVGKAPARTL